MREALAAAQASGDRAGEAAALDRLGWLMHFQALDAGRRRPGPETDAELALFERALAIRRNLGDLAGVGQSAFGAGLVHQVLLHDWATAVPLFREALGLAEEHGDLLTASEAHRHIGFYFCVEDVRPAEAVRHLRLSLELRERVGDERWTPGGTLALGEAHLLAGDRAEALRLLRLAVRQAHDARLHPDRIAQFEDTLRQAEQAP